MGRTLLLLLTIMFHVIPVSSQSTGSLYLTGYVIGEHGPVIGYVKVKQGVVNSVIIGGEHADLFKITKDNALTVRSKRNVPSPGRYNITLNAKTSNGEAVSDFVIIKDTFARNKVIAHRGAWKNTSSPENSIAALNHAVDLGCEGSEFDVHMSSDSIPFINHDANFKGTSIAKTSASALAGLKLDNGEPLPTLEAYLLAGLKQTKTKLILEIKPSELGKEHSIALTQKVVLMVEKFKAQGWVDYISFDYDVCKEVLRLAPYAKVAYLKGDKSPDELAADHFFGLDYHFSVLQKNPDWIPQSKEKKLTINVWTVNEKPVFEEFLKHDVDFITTNEPEMLLSIVRK